MPGTTVKDLQQAGLYSKLKPYLENIKNVDAAIERARANGEWTAADDKKLSLNGNKAWGEFDAFQREQKEDLNYAFKEGFSKANERAVARDVQKNPSKYEPRKYEMPDGSYVVYQKSAKNGKETVTYYNKLGQEISEAVFKRITKITDLKVNPSNGKLLATCQNQRENKIPNVLELVGIGVTRALGIMGACGDDKYEYNPTFETNITATVTVINQGIEELTAEIAKLREENNLSNAKIIELMGKIVDLETKTNQLTEESNKTISELLEEIKDLKIQLATIIINQEKNAENAEKYYQMIINAIGTNSDLLNIVIDQLVQSNTILSSVKELMEQNNADNKEILEAVTKIKYGVDELGLDVKEIKKLMTQISSALTNLPKALKAEFEPYFKQIVSGIADGNVKLADLTKLLQQVNQNIVIGNKQQQEATAKVLAAMSTMNGNMVQGMSAILNAIKSGNTNVIARLDKIIANQEKLSEQFKNYDEKTQKMLGKIYEAITKLTAAVDKLDLDGLSANMAAILKAIQNQPNYTEVLNKILAKLGTLEEGQKTANKNIAELVKLVGALADKFKEFDPSKLMAKLDEILAAIKDHEVKVTVNGTIKVTLCNEQGDVIHEGELDPNDPDGFKWIK